MPCGIETEVLQSRLLGYSSGYPGLVSVLFTAAPHPVKASIHWVNFSWFESYVSLKFYHKRILNNKCSNRHTCVLINIHGSFLNVVKLLFFLEPPWMMFKTYQVFLVKAIPCSGLQHLFTSIKLRFGSFALTTVTSRKWRHEETTRLLRII